MWCKESCHYMTKNQTSTDSTEDFLRDFKNLLICGVSLHDSSPF